MKYLENMVRERILDGLEPLGTVEVNVPDPRHWDDLNFI